MNIKLVLPNESHKEVCEAFVKECKAFDNVFAGESQLSSMDFDDWLKKMYGIHSGTNLPKGYVPATTFLAFDNDELIGFVNIRHELNELLLDAGGHIGYMVRPSKRRLGYAKAILKDALLFVKMFVKIDKVLITCDVDNEASEKTIRTNGGVYEDTRTNELLGTVKRFWITIN